jgi:hypothetical protein
MKNKENTIQKNKGAAMIIVVFFFMFMSLTILIGIITPVVREFKIASANFDSKKSYFTAESGVEDVLYRIKNSMMVGSSEDLTIDDSSTTTTVTDISSSHKEITSLGETGEVERRVFTSVDTGVGASFSYGVLTGGGGFFMSNNSRINGSVYSNGNITGSETGGVKTITGSATAANSPTLAADQENGSGNPPYEIIFGKENASQDFAQSFQVSTTGEVSKAKFYIKKISTPSNITVRIVSNSSGSPSTTNLTTGTISSSGVSTNYGWVEVAFTTNPRLFSGTTYWLVLDSNYSSSKYYKIGLNNNGYANGTGKIGKYSSTWNNTSPSGRDGFFKLYFGGLTGLINGITVGTGSVGNAYAHTVTNATIAGTNYCKTGSGNNKACDTSRDDPVPVVMPISEQNILDWKANAEESGIPYEGNYTVSTDNTLGPKKITGNLNIEETLTISGTIWVQGNLLLSENSKINLAPEYGSSEGVLVVDGTITIDNNATFEGSGTDGSYVLALTTSTSSAAVSLGQNAGAVALYASNGTILVDQNGTAKSLTGYYIRLAENAIITYDDGLANANFINSPSGSWNVSGWKETE